MQTISAREATAQDAVAAASRMMTAGEHALCALTYEEPARRAVTWFGADPFTPLDMLVWIHGAVLPQKHDLVTALTNPQTPVVGIGCEDGECRGLMVFVRDDAEMTLHVVNHVTQWCDGIGRFAKHMVAGGFLLEYLAARSGLAAGDVTCVGVVRGRREDADGGEAFGGGMPYGVPLVGRRPGQWERELSALMTVGAGASLDDPFLSGVLVPMLEARQALDEGDATTAAARSIDVADDGLRRACAAWCHGTTRAKDDA